MYVPVVMEYNFKLWNSGSCYIHMGSLQSSLFLSSPKIYLHLLSKHEERLDKELRVLILLWIILLMDLLILFLIFIGLLWLWQNIAGSLCACSVVSCTPVLPPPSLHSPCCHHPVPLPAFPPSLIRALKRLVLYSIHSTIYCHKTHGCDISHPEKGTISSYCCTSSALTLDQVTHALSTQLSEASNDRVYTNALLTCSNACWFS